MSSNGENRTKYEFHPTWYDMNEKIEDVEDVEDINEEKPKRRFSISELVKSINDLHCQDQHSNADKDFNSLNYLEKNESNIISELKVKLNFDVEPHEEDTNEVKFEKLKLLKQICIAEKFGEEKIGKKKKMADCYMEEYTYKEGELPIYKMPLIDIISEPSLAYVGSDYSEYAIYKAEFDRVVNIFRKTPNAQTIKDKINMIHSNWKKILMSVYCDSILEDSDCSQQDISLDKLTSIKKTLENIKGIPVNCKNSIVNLEKN